MTRPPPPIDEEARLRARTDLTTSLVVEAGAGTGKTTLMVERILHILRSGAAAIDELVAITFTEKAAAELRVRLRAVLERAACDVEDGERDRLRAALDRFDRAQVSTIHAFAQGLLRERPLEAGLDADFGVMDGLGSTLEFDRHWETWLDAELMKSHPAARRALNTGMSIEHLGTIARLLHDERDLLPDRPPAAPATLTTTLTAEALAIFEELEALLPACTDRQDAGYQLIQDRLRWRDIALRAGPEAFERLLAQMAPFKPRGNQQRWQKGAGKRQKELCTDLNEELQGQRRQLGQAVTEGVLGWLAGFVRWYAERRQEAGTAEFQDLLIWARNLLRDHKPVRAAFQRRYRYLLIDEVQDTDPLQAEIVAFLAEDGARADTWQEAQPAAGRLFIVGDPKQAIYRFRRADLAVYFALHELVTSTGGIPLVITQNFRSAPPLIDWVNALFTAIIGPGDRPFQAAYQPLVAAVPRDGSGPRVIALRLAPEAPEGPKPSASARRSMEAGAVARLVRREIAASRWQVHDRATGAIRPARYGDVALLFGVTTEIELFEDALRDAGVPYRMEGGRLFYDRQEVRDLTNALAAVDDPTDGIALTATLLSAPFAFTQEELFLFVDSGGRLDYLAEPGTGWPRIRAAFTLLRELHEQRVSDPPAQVVETLIARTRMAELALLGPGGGQAAGNLFKVVELARAFGAPGRHFHAFVRWLDTARTRTARESDVTISEEGADAVRLMTVHAAKGLEFPIVVLANSRSGVRPEACIVDRHRGVIDLRAGDQHSIFRTAGYDEAASHEQRHAEAELRRLLYVACTRAADLLVIPAFGESAAELHAALAYDGVQEIDAGGLLHAPVEPSGPDLAITAGPEAEQALAERQAWQTQIAALWPTEPDGRPR